MGEVSPLSIQRQCDYGSRWYSNRQILSIFQIGSEKCLRLYPVRRVKSVVGSDVPAIENHTRDLSNVHIIALASYFLDITGMKVT